MTTGSDSADLVLLVVLACAGVLGGLGLTAWIIVSLWDLILRLIDK